MKNFIFLFVVVVFLSACKKQYDAQPTYASYALAQNWAKGTPFYSPNPQIFLEATGIWRSFISFSFTSEAEPDKIGFANPFVPGKGTNALYMNTLYASQSLTSDSGFYNVTIPKCFQLVPKSKDSVESGSVIVLPQTIRLTRRDKTFFDIEIAPSSQPGTYDTRTGTMEVEVQFNEASIGGGIVKRRYRFTP